MTCREARTDLALFAGGDLDDRTRVRELRQHVASCPGCKGHYQSLKSTLKTLGGVGAVDAFASSTWESQHSLWPSIRRELARPPAQFSASVAFKQLRHWTPFAAMTAACVLMFVALDRFGSPREEVSTRGLGAHPPVALQPHEEPRSGSESESRPPQTPPRVQPQF
jgi:hypothetical protein